MSNVNIMMSMIRQPPIRMTHGMPPIPSVSHMSTAIKVGVGKRGAHEMVHRVF